jgi:predicted dehydrogenase
MKDRVRVGIAGLGFMGTTHWNIHRASDKTRIVAAADVDPKKRAGDIAAVSGNIGDGAAARLDLGGVTMYDDVSRMIDDPNVDLVDLCVPTPLHARYVIEALAKGKHVLSEKPLARTLAEAKAIETAVAQASTFHMTGMCVRFWPEYRHAHDMVTSGKLGRVRTATFRRLSPSVDGNAWQNWFMKAELSGGALLDLHLHDVDFIRHLFGRPRAVQAFGLRGVRSDAGIDHVHARYDFGDDRLIVAEGGWCAPKGIPFEMSFQIIGERATARLSETGYRVVYEDGRIEQPKFDIPTGWHAEIEHMATCILSNKRPDDIVPIDGVVDAIAIAEAEARSIEAGTPVVIQYR